MDASSGRVLLEHKGRTPLPVASTTKIMTAILALEKGDLSDVVTVGEKPYNTGGSTIWLDIGEQQTLENLMYALLESANDAAVAIAEHLGGTEEQFVAWMNEKAKAIGAEQTHFVNSHGLHDPDHYSTAYDLALIGRYAMQNPEYRRIANVIEVEIPGFKTTPPRRLYNKNRLLGYYEGADGVKNGFTEEALLTNVASARRGETAFIAVVLGAEDRVWTSSMALLDYGFSHYQARALVKKDEPLGAVPVATGRAMVNAVAKGDMVAALPLNGPEPRRVVEWAAGLRAPLPAGAPVGRVRILVGEEEVGSVDLVTEGPVEGPSEPQLAAAASAGGETPGMVYLTWGTLLGIATLVWAMQRNRNRKGRI